MLEQQLKDHTRIAETFYVANCPPWSAEHAAEPLRENASQSSVLEFLREARRSAAAFEERFTQTEHFVITPQMEAGWDSWANSVPGADSCCRLAQTIFNIFDLNTLGGVPGHDLRHIGIKDPTSALEFCVEENLSGYKPLFLVASLLHDTGRLVEARLINDRYARYVNADHTSMSFLFALRVLNLYHVELPPGLTDHLLFSVLRHQGGAKDASVLLGAVQRADREQLVGPEGLARMFTYDMGFRGLKLRFDEVDANDYELAPPSANAEKPWYQHIEFYLRNLYPDIGRCANERADERKAISGRFLWLALPEKIRDAAFAPELARDAGTPWSPTKLRPLLAEHVWQAIRADDSPKIADRVQELQFRPISDLLRLALLTPGTMRLDKPINLPHSPIQFIRENLLLLDAEDRGRMKVGLAYAIATREQFDQREAEFIAGVIRSYPKTTIERQVARFVQKQITAKIPV